MLALLEAAGALRVQVPVLCRRENETSSDIDAAIAQQTLCVLLMPPFPTRAMQGVPFVFYEGAELRARIVEQPKLNSTGADAYDLADDVALALHWTNPGGVLAHPLELAHQPFKVVEDSGTRIIEVIFNAQFQINPVSP